MKDNFKETFLQKLCWKLVAMSVIAQKVEVADIKFWWQHKLLKLFTKKYFGIWSIFDFVGINCRNHFKFLQEFILLRTRLILQDKNVTGVLPQNKYLISVIHNSPSFSPYPKLSVVFLSNIQLQRPWMQHYTQTSECLLLLLTASCLTANLRDCSPNLAWTDDKH